MIKLKGYIQEKLVSNKIILEEDADIYGLGFECLLLKLIHCISYLCIGFLMNMIPELLVIGCVLLPLRRNAGGYHAKTRLGCYIFSCIYISILLLISTLEIHQLLWWTALIVSDLIIIYMAPVDNENKKLDNEEFVFYKKRSRFILALANVVCIFLSIININKLGNLLMIGIVASSSLLVLQKLSESRFIAEVRQHNRSQD